MAYVPLRKAVKRLGLHPNTLRKYADDGTIPSIKNAAGQRLFEVDAYLRVAQRAATICYCRVSSHKQRDALERQVERVRAIYPSAEIVRDIGSGLNFKRKGLNSILERILRGDKFQVVVTHRDRLTRFGFDMFRFLVEKNGGAILALDPGLGSPEDELTQDLLAILHHFSCKRHGRRSHQGKAAADLSDSGTEKSFSSMVRDFSTRLQRDGKTLKPVERSEAETLDGCSESDHADVARMGETDPLSSEKNGH